MREGPDIGSKEKGRGKDIKARKCRKEHGKRKSGWEGRNKKREERNEH